MLPRTVLAPILRTEGDRVAPRYFTERDHPWLRALLAEFARSEGCKLSEHPGAFLPVPAPRSKARIATAVLTALVPGRPKSRLRPAEVRWRLFHAAASSPADRADTIVHVANCFDATPTELEAALFADLRAERRIGPLPPDLSPSSLAARANLEIVSSLVRRSSVIRITASGAVERLVRHARRLGLICTIRPLVASAPERAVGDGLTTDRFASPGIPNTVAIDISGPLALFHHTEVYGRALASLVPALATCQDFELVARCKLSRGTSPVGFVLRSEDPVFDDSVLTAPDVRFEERLTRAFRRRAPDWTLHWTPVALNVGGTLLFPDVELVHRDDERRRFSLIFPGFWTVEHLDAQLRALAAAALNHVLLCVDDRRRAGEGDPPEHPQLIRYRTTLDPRDVIARIAP